MITIEDMMQCYLKARANKRRSRDAVHFETNLEANLVSLMHEVNAHALRTDSNYAFVVYYPKAREIFATDMRVRVIHHYLEWKLRPIYEAVISNRSFNNRKAMGLYINDVVKWLQSHDFLRVVVFVDDIYIVAVDKSRALSLIPEIRQRLDKLNVSLNERKFYCQHCTKAFRILGVRIKYGREVTDDSVRSHALAGLTKVSSYGNSIMHELGRIQSSVNTYVGMFKTKSMYGTLEKYKKAVLSVLGRYMVWNCGKSCFSLKRKYSFKNMLSRKYGVRL